MATDTRWEGIERLHGPEVVDTLRGSLQAEGVHLEDQLASENGGDSETTALSGSTEEAQFRG